MVSIGIALLIVEGFTLLGSVLNDVRNNQAIGTSFISNFKLPTRTIDFIELVGYSIGYFLPAIIGIILLIIARKRKMKRNGLYDESKRRSIIGLFVCILVTVYCLFIWMLVDELRVSTENWASYVVATYEQYKILVTFSAIICFVAYFARKRWCYLIGAAALVIGMILYSRMGTISAAPIILAILLVVVYIETKPKQENKELESYTVTSESQNTDRNRPSLNEDPEIFNVLQHEFENTAKEVFPSFLESVVKKEPVYNSLNRTVKITPADVSWFSATNVELACFYDSVFVFIIRYYLGELYVIPAERMKEFLIIKNAELQQIIQELQLSRIVEERENTYQFLWNTSSTIEEAENKITSCFSSYCSFAFNHERMGTQKEVDEEIEECNNDSYYQIVYHMSSRIFNLCVERAHEAIEKYWKERNIYQET